jgi:hypothetical protein
MSAFVAANIDRFVTIGISLPTAPKIGRLYFDISTNPATLYVCLSAGTWTQISTGLGSNITDDIYHPVAGTTAFVLSHTPITGSVHVFVNGVLQDSSVDYTLSGTTVTLAVSTVTGDTVIVSYLY